MSSERALPEPFSITVENIGGIDQTAIDIHHGLTVLEGKNATNRTSFLQSIMAAMGSDQYTLKGDTEAGYVELELGDTVVERRFERRNGDVVALDDGFLEAPELADLFAFLVEENEARRAIERGDDLHDVITRPIDTAEIEAEIERLQATKRSLDDHLERIDERSEERPALQKRKEALENTIDQQRSELDDIEAQIEATDVGSGTAETASLEGDFQDLTEKRSEFDEIRFEIETLEETIESLKSERQTKANRREEIVVDPDTDLDSLKRELQELRERKRRVNSQMSELQSIVQFNEDMLEGTDSEIASVLRSDPAREEDDDEGDTVTEHLVGDEDSTVCWTCGSTVDEADIESTLSELRTYRQEKFGERQSIESDIEALQSRIREYEQVEHELEELTERIAEIDAALDDKRERLEELESRREDLHEELETLEAAVEEGQASDDSELVELHKEANTLELKIEQSKDELASVEDELAEIDALVEERETYDDRRAQVTDELEALRTRIDQLENDAVEAFNTHMAEVLDVLEYDNLARVWIERQERQVRDGRRTVDESHFELHIVREPESGATYQGTVETLSESEREVVGLVFALAGYLVHDVHEEVPVMLLDSLEAIDSDRIARFVDYFAEYPDFLVVALLPEDASSIETEHDTVREI